MDPLKTNLQILGEVATKYGWKAVERFEYGKGCFQLLNRKDVVCAHVKVNGRGYRVNLPNGVTLMTGRGKLAFSVENVLKNYFYASLLNNG